MMATPRRLRMAPPIRAHERLRTFVTGNRGMCERNGMDIGGIIFDISAHRKKDNRIEHQFQPFLTANLLMKWCRI